MATSTAHYGFTKPGMNDYADISVINTDLDNIDTAIYNNQVRSQAALDDMAPEYDATATYSVGDYVIYNKTLYRCTTAVTTAEAFDDTKWTADKVGAEIKNHDARISTLEAGIDLEKSATNSFNDGIDSYFKKVVSSIVPVQAGSGTPSPTNVRAISGFTECAVLNRGSKNICNTIGTDTSNGYFADKYIRSDGALSPGAYSGFITEYTPIFPNKTYTLTGPGGQSPAICFYDNTKTYISGIAYNGSSTITFTTPANTAYFRASIAYTSVDNVQLEEGSTATTHEDYSTASTTATISFGSAGTVYSGYVDLISGKMGEDSDYFQPTAVDSVGVSDGTFYWVISLPNTSINGVDGLISSHFEAADGVAAGHCYITANGSKLVCVPTDQTLNTRTLADAWLVANQPQFVYPLATPVEYQLTPAQLRSLVGANNLTSSTGEVTEVEYITNETIAWLLDLIRA